MLPFTSERPHNHDVSDFGLRELEGTPILQLFRDDVRHLLSNDRSDEPLKQANDCTDAGDHEWDELGMSRSRRNDGNRTGRLCQSNQR